MKSTRKNAASITCTHHVLLFSFVIMLVTVVSTEAQGQLGIGPVIGFYKAQDQDAMKAMGGVAVRLRLSPGLGAEGSINYRREQYANDLVEVKSWPVMATGLIYVLPVVYGAIGAGWYNSNISYHVPANLVGQNVTVSSETAQRFGWHFGGGVELPVGELGKLTADIRYVFLDYKFQTIPGTGGLKSNFYVLGAGFFFGL